MKKLALLLRVVPIGLVAVAACNSNTKSEPAVAAPIAAPATAPTPVLALEPVACGGVEKLHAFGSIWLGSQPTAEDFQLIRERGVRKVINLRKPEELKEFDEGALLTGLGIEYVTVPFASPQELRDDQIDQVRALLTQNSQQPVFLHCASSNRVGAIWLAHRVLDAGLEWEAALAEAKRVGLKTPAYEGRIQQYIEARRK